MKSRKMISAMALLVALAIPVSVAAQEHHTKHHKYKVVDLGTFGGPNSYLGILNDHGTGVGGADTSTTDPNSPNCFNPDCFVSHAFQWQEGVVTDLGALPGVNSSVATSIGANGLIAGFSQNSLIDPVTGQPETRAVLWNGGINDLGTLGGDESLGFAVNSRGLVAGPAANTTADQFGMYFFGWGTQTRAFVSQNGGKMRDLGTLGGPDAYSGSVNERGQVAGAAYTNSTPNGTTGQPTLDPFFWERGKKMVDVGTLGGTLGSTYAMNNRGEVVGQSNLAGDLTSRPFSWRKPGPMKDLGTLGGDNGFASWVNDRGDVTGRSDVPGSKTHHGFLWRKGVLTDLGSFRSDACSTGWGINRNGQIVGTAGVQAGGCNMPGHGFLWENGGPIVDLNTLIPPGSGLQVIAATSINERGEIEGLGTLSNGDTHAVLLIPCDRAEGDGDCGDHAAGTAATIVNNATPVPQNLTITTPQRATPGGVFTQPRARGYRTLRGGA